MTESEQEARIEEAFARERLCENFKVIAQWMREWLAELDAQNRVVGHENKVGGAQVLSDILARVDAKKDTVKQEAEPSEENDA